MAVKYHPDKVSHLGDEVKKLAEEKFKMVKPGERVFKVTNK